MTLIVGDTFELVSPVTVIGIHQFSATVIAGLMCAVWWFSRSNTLEDKWVILSPKPSRNAIIILVLFAAYAFIDLVFSQHVDAGRPQFEYLRLSRCIFPTLLLMSLVQARVSYLPLVLITSFSSVHILVYSFAYAGSSHGPHLRQLLFISLSLVFACAFWRTATQLQKFWIILMLAFGGISASMLASWWTSQISELHSIHVWPPIEMLPVR